MQNTWSGDEDNGRGKAGWFGPPCLGLGSLQTVPVLLGWREDKQDEGKRAD